MVIVRSGDTVTITMTAREAAVLHDLTVPAAYAIPGDKAAYASIPITAEEHALANELGDTLAEVIVAADVL